MLFKKSQNQRKISQKLIEISGEPFTIFEIYKNNINGSPRYQLIEISKNEFTIDLLNHNDLIYATIELRKKGIVVYFRYMNEEYQIACNYNQLSYISNDGKFELQTNKHLLKLKVKDLKKQNIFLQNLIKCKTRINFSTSVY